MKVQLNRSHNPSSQGFTLIEMIGVLAVIAILAAVLIPKVFEAINNARINGAAMGIQTMKTGVVDHYAKYGSLLVGVTNAANAPGPFAVGDTFGIEFDTVLLTEQLVDKLFQTKISDPPAQGGTRVQLLSLANPAAVDGVNAFFDLDGVGGTATDISGSLVAVAVLPNVAAGDAWELSKRIDGDAMSAANANAASDDLRGRVKYSTANPRTVYVYLTHR